MIHTNCFYTAHKREDGFGSQFQYYIWNILYTELNGGKFIMPIIDKIEHNYDNDPDYIKKVRNFMNLEKVYSGYQALLYELPIYFLDMRKVFKFLENNIDLCLESKSMLKIKKAFWEKKNLNEIYFKDDNIFDYYNIAVHIRRQNQSDGNNYKLESKIPLEYYKQKIYEACEKYLFSFGVNKKKPIRIFIYSQGNEEEFNVFQNNEYGEVILKINDNMFSTFLGMAAADALILSASSYSYIAAYFCDGEIYYYPFWHSPSKNWIISKNVPFIDIPDYDKWLDNLR